ncbi:MAG TPA: hypothetical protein VEB20_19965 [Azospirillaceae bacterium]|nr:hypothetical protein [Azospirillaceae bacterium]
MIMDSVPARAEVPAEAGFFADLLRVTGNLGEASVFQASACRNLADGIERFSADCADAVARLTRFRAWQDEVAAAMELALRDPDAAAALRATLKERLGRLTAAPG